MLFQEMTLTAVQKHEHDCLTPKVNIPAKGSLNKVGTAAEGPNGWSWVFGGGLKDEVVVDPAEEATEPLTGEDFEVVDNRPSEEIRRLGSKKPPEEERSSKIN